ncbi:MAG TPA: metallophosphoesterase family protein [Dehalococcoidia bacterium]|nr:metallophosphoesterase family protein [Dehalococcoidia bacterium]
MRIAIVSDVHANLVALEAVLRHAEAQGALDGLWCLGDMVGYGPQPCQVLERLRESGAQAVVGNHDLAAVGLLPTDDFNPAAAAAVRWTARQLQEPQRRYIESLPQILQRDDFTLVHGTLRWPVWEYLYSYDAARGHLRLQGTPFGLVGHTHIPMLVVEDDTLPQGCELFYLPDGAVVELRQGPRLVINPGSVGQPRDGDPRASYAIYDSDRGTVSLHRVEYDIAATQRLMEAAGLPRWLSERLAVGR